MGIFLNGWCGGFTGIRYWYYDSVTGNNVTLGTSTSAPTAGDFSSLDFSSADFSTGGSSTISTTNVEWLSQGVMPLLNGNYA